MSIVSPPKPSFITPNPYSSLADTTASHNYLDEMAIPHCNKPVPAFGPHVKVANGNIITLMAQTEMHLLNELSAQAQRA